MDEKLDFCHFETWHTWIQAWTKNFNLCHFEAWFQCLSYLGHKSICHIVFGSKYLRLDAGLRAGTKGVQVSNSCAEHWWRPGEYQNKCLLMKSLKYISNLEIYLRDFISRHVWFCSFPYGRLVSVNSGVTYRTLTLLVIIILKGYEKHSLIEEIGVHDSHSCPNTF